MFKIFTKFKALLFTAAISALWIWLNHLRLLDSLDGVFAVLAKVTYSRGGTGGTILQIASLGYLGIGIAPPTPEWGTIISENQSNIMYHPYLGIIPGLFIMIAVLSLNFVGDGLRDALDPKLSD